MNTFFKKEDFKLCYVPVPKGYPQSQTHSGVSLYKGKYYLTTSPYPSYSETRYKRYFKKILRKLSFDILFPLTRAEAYENPCLYVQDIGNGIPTAFKLMQQRALMDTPENYYNLPAFNSDPDIFIEEGKIHVLNRPVYRTKLCPGEALNRYEIRLYMISGEIDEERFKLERIFRIASSETRVLISPCFFKYNTEYYILELETNAANDGCSFDGLYKISSKQIDGLKDNNMWEKIELSSPKDILPWHISVFKYNGILYAIITCIKKGEKQHYWQMLGEFNKDLSCLKIFSMPLTDYNSYRGSAVVNDKGEFVLYSTTVQERIVGGKSVDGREVIMAHAPFEDVIEKIKLND